MCGTSTTLSSASSSAGTCGSRSNTSSAAPAMRRSAQRAHQRRLVDHRAARHVDQEAVGAERLEHRWRRSGGACLAAAVMTTR
jgi:hypothetical protein